MRQPDTDVTFSWLNCSSDIPGNLISTEHFGEKTNDPKRPKLKIVFFARFQPLVAPSSYPMAPPSPSTNNTSSSSSSTLGWDQLSKTNLYIRGLSPSTTDHDLVNLCQPWVPHFLLLLSAIDQLLIFFFLACWGLESGWDLYWHGALEGNVCNVVLIFITLLADCEWEYVFFRLMKEKKTFPDIMWIFALGKRAQGTKGQCVDDDSCSQLVVHQPRRLMTDAVSVWFAHSSPRGVLP